MSFTLFFDGHCPLCSAEMRQLNSLDHLGLLKLVDLHQADFTLLYPHVNKVQAINILQAQQSDGTMLYGLDANCKAWELVGKKRWLRILRWPVIRILADLGYMFFAKKSLHNFISRDWKATLYQLWVGQFKEIKGGQLQLNNLVFPPFLCLSLLDRASHLQIGQEVATKSRKKDSRFVSSKGSYLAA